MINEGTHRGHKGDAFSAGSIFLGIHRGLIGDTKGTKFKIDLALMLYRSKTIWGVWGLIYIISIVYLYLYAYMLYICSIYALYPLLRNLCPQSPQSPQT